MSKAIAFDVYSTLVDPVTVSQHLHSSVGEELAHKFAVLWRQKQLEYSLRRGLMRRYENFDVCTRQALLFTINKLYVDISDGERERLIEELQNLQAYPDVVPGMRALRTQEHELVAFSNGVESTVRTLLKRAGVLCLLDRVISVDDVRTFKPDPAVYDYLVRCLGRPKEDTWLVSGGPGDVIGARSAGLKAAWIQRRPDAVFDPWEMPPDLVVRNVKELSEQLK